MPEFVGQGGLPNSRLPGDEDDLTLARVCLCQPFMQLPERPVSPRERPSCCPQRRCGAGLDVFADGGNEPIAAFGYGFDEVRVLWIIAECVAYIEDAFLDRLRFDHSLAPYAFQQLLLCYQASGVFDEILQDGKRLGRHRNALVGLHVADPPEAL